MDRRQEPIGVFDSGVGGISVLREMVRLLPKEDFYYIGDSIHAPYGTKSIEQIQQLTLGHAEDMVQRGVKALVIACNTATSAAIVPLRKRYADIPVIGIEPALKPAVLSRKAPTVLVMATPSTVRGEKYKELMDKYASKARIIPLGCDGLMEFVEAGVLEGEALEQCLRKLFAPYRQERIDAVVLGCTHYPFVQGAIRRALGQEVLMLDGSVGTAKELRRRLAQKHWLREDAHAGQVTFHMTKPGMEQLCEKLLHAEQ